MSRSVFQILVRVAMELFFRKKTWDNGGELLRTSFIFLSRRGGGRGARGGSWFERGVKRARACVWGGVL